MNPGPVPPGGSANQPSGSTPLIRRKKPQSDPFFKGPRKPVQPNRSQPNGHLTPPVNGHKPLKPHALRPSTPGAILASSPLKPAVPETDRVSGFTDPRVTAEGIVFRDYKLVATKRDLLNSSRYHILQLSGDKNIDIRNESEFAKPARLHRRDPRAQPPGHLQKEEPDPDPKDGLNATEREELTRRKEIRQKEREANLAQIAPSQNAGKKAYSFKKKTQQVFQRDFSAVEKRRIQTNYEEKLPWHLEDFDNKHCLVGHHQSGSMNSHAALIYEPANDGSNGLFRLVPVEKLYQFKSKRELAAQMTIEEVEAAMKKRGTDPEWLIRQREARVAEAAKELTSKQSRGLITGAQKGAVAGRGGEDADLDFEDDFADDEEGDLFIDKDEDEKLAEKKIKEDQLTANFLDFKDVKEYDEAEAREKREAEAKKKNFRELRKALERRERNYNHGSDSEGASSTDSEEERERIENERLANIKREEDAAKSAAGISSSGTNTPNNRKEKIPGTGNISEREGVAGMKKSSSTRSLKRPGSPNLSDASGTDASTTHKKKHKSKHLSSTRPTPGPSRPMSPANVPPGGSAAQNLDPSSAALSKVRRRMAGSNAGSDTDKSDRDGGAMSDGSLARQRLKWKVSASLPPGVAGTTSPQSTSRAGSPAAPKSPQELPSAQEIKNAIPPEGMHIKDLMRTVAHPKEQRAAFVALMRSVARLDKEKEGWLMLK